MLQWKQTNRLEYKILQYGNHVIISMEIDFAF